MIIGLDFGTTNSVLSYRASADAEPVLWRVPTDAGETDNYRSVLYMEPSEDGGRKLSSWAGPAALSEYAAYGTGGRLVQSMKSYLASPHFTATSLFGQQFTLEQLIARFLGHLREDAARSQIMMGAELRVGRPVHFVGEDNTLAERRLGAAFNEAGFERCHFIEEPIAASYAFAQQADAPGMVLIADIGGGTTDYAVVEIIKPGLAPQLRVVATGGVGVAGDDLDAAIIDNIVAPAFGRDEILQNGQPVPKWLYEYLRRWHFLSFLKTPQNIALLKDLARQQNKDEKRNVAHLLRTVEENKAFALAQAVAKTKQVLSSAEKAVFSFSIDGNENGSAPIAEAEVTRTAFEAWTAPVRQKMQASLEDMLEKASLAPEQINHVFMTGGTSFVPSVRRVFEQALPRAILHGGGELVSVGKGLVLAG